MVTPSAESVQRGHGCHAADHTGLPGSPLPPSSKPLAVGKQGGEQLVGTCVHARAWMQGRGTLSLHTYEEGRARSVRMWGVPRFCREFHPLGRRPTGLTAQKGTASRPLSNKINNRTRGDGSFTMNWSVQKFTWAALSTRRLSVNRLRHPSPEMRDSSSNALATEPASLSGTAL